MKSNIHIKDNYFRNLIISVLKILNEKIYYTVVYDDNKVEEIKIPFFYEMTGDQNLLIEYFYDIHSEINYNIAGNYSDIPRGIVRLNGVSVNTSSLTNRFVRGKYEVYNPVTKNIETRVSNINLIYLTVNFTVEIVVDNKFFLFEVLEKIISNFYKACLIKFLWKRFPIKGHIYMSDSVERAQKEVISLDNVDSNKLTFSLDGEVYLPVFDRTVERSINNVIKSFSSNLEIMNDIKSEKPRRVGFEALTEALRGKITSSEILNRVSIVYNYYYDENNLIFEPIVIE